MPCRYWLCYVGYVHCALRKSVAYGIIAKLQTLISLVLMTGLVATRKRGMLTVTANRRFIHIVRPQPSLD
jgi:hypothetical protein